MATATDVPNPGLPGQEEGLFVRKSSGLVREVGVRDSLGVGLGVLLLIAVYSGTAIFLEVFPNGDFYLPIIVGGVISFVLAFAYAQLVGTFPRAGGEYVYASRIFTPLVGAAVGGAVLIGVAYGGASNIVSMCQVYVPFMFATLGHALHIHGLQTFASTTLTHKGAWVITGLVIIGICVAVCLRPIHTAARFVFWTFLLGLLTTLLIAVILLLETRTGFIHAFNAASGGHAYQEIIRKAAASGFHPGVKSGAVVALLPVGALLFLGFTYGNYAAGEIKRPTRTYKIAVFGALGVGFVGLLLGWAAMRHVAGIDFLQSSASLQASDPAAYAHLTTVPQAQGGLAYAILAAGDPVTSTIIAIGTMLAWFSMAIAFVLLSTRIIFALSFDRLLPTKLADVDKRTHAPVYALLLVALIMAAFTTIGNVGTLLTVFRNFLIVTNGILVVGAVCAAALPYRRPELFDASPKILRGRILGLPAITLVAGLAALAFLGVVVDVASRTAYSGGYSTASIATLVIVVFLGVVLYFTSRANLARRGIDLRMAMHELPPE